MKDVTSTSFGLFIAFLLPGLEGLYTLTLWFKSVSRVFEIFLTSESNVGLFLLVISAGVTLGLIMAAFRWMLFELWVCRQHKLRGSDFAQLGVEAKLLAFRAAIDEHYRYHQFYGATAVIVPFFYAGLVYQHWGNARTVIMILLPILAAIEYGMWLAAIGSYRAFVARAKFILENDARILRGALN